MIQHTPDRNERVTPAEALERMAIAHAHKIEWRIHAEHTTWCDSACLHVIRSAKEWFLAHYGEDRYRAMPASEWRLQVKRSIKNARELPDTKLGETVAELVEGVLSDVVQVMFGRDFDINTFDEPLTLEQVIDLYDHGNHFLAMHTGHLFNRLKDPTTQWKKNR